PPDAGETATTWPSTLDSRLILPPLGRGTSCISLAEISSPGLLLFESTVLSSITGSSVPGGTCCPQREEAARRRARSPISRRMSYPLANLVVGQNGIVIGWTGDAA